MPAIKSPHKPFGQQPKRCEECNKSASKLAFTTAAHGTCWRCSACVKCAPSPNPDLLPSYEHDTRSAAVKDAQREEYAVPKGEIPEYARWAVSPSPGHALRLEWERPGWEAPPTRAGNVIDITATLAARARYVGAVIRIDGDPRAFAAFLDSKSETCFVQPLPAY